MTILQRRFQIISPVVKKEPDPSDVLEKYWNVGKVPPPTKHALSGGMKVNAQIILPKMADSVLK
jgi:hypothetical protein